MAIQPERKYQRGSRVAIEKTASTLNQLHHDGNPVRTARAVGKFFGDYERGLRQ